MSAAPTMKRRRSSTADRSRAYGKPPARARRVSIVVGFFLVARAARRALGHAAAAAADEGEQVVDVRRVDLRLDTRHRQRQVRALAKEDAEGGGERGDARPIEPGAPEPDAVQAAHAVRLVHHGERWHVTRRARETAHDREPSDAA